MLFMGGAFNTVGRSLILTLNIGTKMQNICILNIFAFSKHQNMPTYSRKPTVVNAGRQAPKVNPLMQCTSTVMYKKEFFDT